MSKLRTLAVLRRPDGFQIYVNDRELAKEVLQSGYTPSPTVHVDAGVSFRNHAVSA